MKIAANKITPRISSFEEHTGIELIVVIANSSDPYPGASWRGALMSSTFITAGLSYFQILNLPSEILLTNTLLTIALRVLLKLTTLHRFFLWNSETQRESLEAAMGKFSEFQTLTNHQSCLLLYISKLEHKLHILVDKNLKEFISNDELKSLLMQTGVEFRAKHPEKGILHLIDQIEEKIQGKIPSDWANKVERSEIENRVFYC